MSPCTVVGVTGDLLGDWQEEGPVGAVGNAEPEGRAFSKELWESALSSGFPRGLWRTALFSGSPRGACAAAGPGSSGSVHRPRGKGWSRIVSTGRGVRGEGRREGRWVLVGFVVALTTSAGAPLSPSASSANGGPCLAEEGRGAHLVGSCALSACTGAMSDTMVEDEDDDKEGDVDGTEVPTMGRD